MTSIMSSMSDSPERDHLRIKRSDHWLGIPMVAWLLLCATAANIPFIGQAYQMDDGIYLLIARNVQHNPWFPQDIPVIFEGLHGTDLASTEHPWPLTSYLLALFGSIGGFSEKCLHLAFLLFPITLAWAMYSLSSGFTRHPFLAALTLLALPVVSVLSHTLMTDIPLLAFWVTAVALFRRGLLSWSVWRIMTASIVAALACLVTYSGLILVLLLAFYAVLRHKPTAAFVMVIVPASALTALLITNYLHYHRVSPEILIGSYLSAKRVLSPVLVSEKVTFAALALGAVTVSPLFALFVHRYRTVLAVLAGALALGLMPQVARYSLEQKTLLVLFAWAGLCLLVTVCNLMIRSLSSLSQNLELPIEDLFLGLWFIGVFLFCVTAYMTGSARYLLPATPPLILILFRSLETRRDAPSVRRLAMANLALCATLSAVLSLADFQFAAVYRKLAATLAQSYPSGTRKTWFTGEWGLRAYLEQAGGQELGRRDARATPGDLLVVPNLATPYETLYGKQLSLRSITMLAPSSVSFAVPPVPPGGVLIYTRGMPFYAASDGMDFKVSFRSDEGDHVLSQGQIPPDAGRQWRIQEVDLSAMAGKPGRIEFEAGVGRSGNAYAYWTAIARARIAVRRGDKETVAYDFLEHLKDARITPAAGVIYHTDRNLPVFPMDVWLDQEPATILLNRSEYRIGLPVRTLDDHSHAGFWSSSWGLLPFSIAEGNGPLESISVFEVTRKVDDYGERPLSWYEK